MKAVLFDLDGTLLDTAPDFSFVLDTMMARRQRRPVPYARVHETVSDGARGMIQLYTVCIKADFAQKGNLRR